jgi:hypothetical protein
MERNVNGAQYYCESSVNVMHLVTRNDEYDGRPHCYSRCKIRTEEVLCKVYMHGTVFFCQRARKFRRQKGPQHIDWYKLLHIKHFISLRTSATRARNALHELQQKIRHPQTRVVDPQLLNRRPAHVTVDASSDKAPSCCQYRMSPLHPPVLQKPSAE